MSSKQILLDHGSGGLLTHDLITSLFVKYFDNDILRGQGDSAILPRPQGQLAFTTDSYVINPIFFPGGNIGKLAICGTVNDLAVSGATPLYISCGFIIEEGFSFFDLETIVQSMAAEANKAGVKIVTGDTKVVERGACDKLFINTSGIGALDPSNAIISGGTRISVGDKIIINGTLADHGMAIMGKRNELDFHSDIQSDCACLNSLIKLALSTGAGIHFMRDATRGGVATVLCEVAGKHSLGVMLDEASLPLNENTRGICELLGFDPLYVANEGKVIMIVAADQASKVLAELQKDPLGKRSAIIGEIVAIHPGKVVLNTEVGGTRIVDMLTGAQLPRIC